MADKWETVGKAKPANGKAGKVNGVGGKVLSKKQEAKVYTMEDALPASSIENMYQAAFTPQTNGSPRKEKKESNGVAGKPKPKAEKKAEKPRLPGSVVQAVKENLRVEDLKLLLESSQSQFPDSPLLWLRDAAAYLNLRLVTAGEEAEETLLGGGPATALTVNMKKVINVMLQKCSEGMKETFFETCVANTAHDLSKGNCVAGWKILTQLLAETSPTLVTAHISRYIELRNSYQNRPAVGLAILWSTGQAGLKSLHSGIKVWMEIMLPLITMRHYSKFVVDYITVLLAVHNVTKDTMMNKPVMDISNFNTVQDTVFVVSSQMNKEHARSLREVYPALRAICVAGCKNHELFPELLERLPKLTMPDALLDTLELLAGCLSATPAAIVHWHKMYTSNLPASGQLLHFIGANWPAYRTALDVPDFHDTIEAFSDYNISVINKEGLALATEGCNLVEGKLSTPAMAWFPWKLLSFLLLIATGAILNLDVERTGSFGSSNTGQFLQDVGQYDRVVRWWTGAGAGLGAGQAWLEREVPPVLALARPAYQAAEARAGEAWQLARLSSALAAEYAREGVARLDGLVPGARARLEGAGEAGVEAGRACLALAKQGGTRLQEAALQLLNGEVDWNGLGRAAVHKVEVLQQQLQAAVKMVRSHIEGLVK